MKKYTPTEVIMGLVSFSKSSTTSVEVFTIKNKSLECVNTMIMRVHNPKLMEETRDG